MRRTSIQLSGVLLVAAILAGFFMRQRMSSDSGRTPRSESSFFQVGSAGGEATEQNGAAAAGGGQNPVVKDKVLALVSGLTKEEAPEHDDAKGAAHDGERNSPESRFFPRARIIAQMEMPGAEPGNIEVKKILETNFKNSAVRVHSTYKKNERGGRDLVREVAMVADQAVLTRTEDLGESEFFAILEQAPADLVKKLEASDNLYLVRFAGGLQDPLALETFLARLRELSGGRITPEPNYIRKAI